MYSELISLVCELIFIQYIGYIVTYMQGRNDVFKVGAPIQFLGLQKKLDRSTQFAAVGYIITLYSSKNYVISWGSVQI